MTYCVGMMLDGGMIFASDSRTNAGVDQIACFRKLRAFERPGNRVIVILSSGNLSVTQSTLNLIEHSGRATDAPVTLWNARSMADVATLVGDSLREVRRRDGAFLLQGNVDAGASFLVGGQIGGEGQRLFLVYSEGNFIEATPETPFFQVGETKYGRPIIDRVVTHDTALTDATKCVLVSFDSTMRSNISVGPPIDLLVYENGSLRIGWQRSIEEGDAYFSLIRRQWSEGLRRVFAELPNPSWDDSRNALPATILHPDGATTAPGAR